MLAHKAAHQGKVAAETVAGLKNEFSPLTIPSVAYTDPRACLDRCETEAKKGEQIFQRACTLGIAAVLYLLEEKRNHETVVR